jgi:exonuclease III
MKSILKCSCWNVNGLCRRSDNYCKLDDDDFMKQIIDFDSIGLVETHLGPDDKICIPGYNVVTYTRPKCQNALKHSGGISVLISNTILRGVNTNIKMSDYGVWIKLQKEFLNADRDLYIGVIYLPPENSTFSRRQEIDVINSLEEDINLFSKTGEILLLGDFNGHTCTKADLIENDSGNSSLQICHM